MGPWISGSRLNPSSPAAERGNDCDRDLLPYGGIVEMK